MDRLAGKLAVITGIGPGIGSAIARRFVREGANLVLAGFANPAFEETTEFLRRSGARVAVVHGDVGRRTIWDQIARDADAQFGRVHIVVNSAATGRFAPILDIPEDEWDETMRTNLKSVYFSCQTFIPRMIAAGGGVFVNVSSVNGSIASPSLVAYATSKGALNALTRNIALDYGPKGIRANAIAPGAIFSPSAAARLDEEEARSIRDNYPVGRWGTPEDVANATLYLASDEASFVTGAVLTVDGGLTIQTPEAAVRKSFRARWRSSRLSLEGD
ncbi:MAG TPA: SDR family oxidoreductase [Roseiarcus sp.]|jgi:NAD(P)-dependent dehydrogenase (short-subunit alcohol dehydrogenase family)